MEETKQEATTQEATIQKTTADKQGGQRDKVFREKSLERISEPEQLHDYIRVTSPSVWLVLLAIIVLLAGVFVWGVFGRLTIHKLNGTTKEIAPITLVTN